ncbi:Uncharacterized protein FWK35_00031944 [Aphis craccivora]|uniref:Uncharacterized protein n=1 Tax=Aphis craccivora TaxID=307492 RepID=A0A6G0YEZ0_APHCR|nr:Uncharacterized protein FWK35_00031944 [Aphis craccivora]
MVDFILEIMTLASYLTYTIRTTLFIKTITNYCVALDVDIIQFPDSERSDECIDFTMMCSITSRNNVSISNFLGGFRW